MSPWLRGPTYMWPHCFSLLPTCLHHSHLTLDVHILTTLLNIFYTPRYHPPHTVTLLLPVWKYSQTWIVKLSFRNLLETRNDAFGILYILPAVLDFAIKHPIILWNNLIKWQLIIRNSAPLSKLANDAHNNITSSYFLWDETGHNLWNGTQAPRRFTKHFIYYICICAKIEEREIKKIQLYYL